MRRRRIIRNAAFAAALVAALLLSLVFWVFVAADPKPGPHPPRPPRPPLALLASAVAAWVAAARLDRWRKGP